MYQTQTFAKRKKIQLIEQIELFGKPHTPTKSFLRRIVALNEETNSELIFLTNIKDMEPIEIASTNKKRWGIEVFF
jgi:hypothetical protein